MAKSGDFEVADSSCQFRGIGHFLGAPSFGPQKVHFLCDKWSNNKKLGTWQV